MAADAPSFNPDAQLMLDQPLLKVPYELSRKNFKTAQRHVDRAKEEVLSTLKSSSADASNPTAALDTMIARMEGLKRKLAGCHDEEKKLHKASRARIEHVASLHEILTLSDVKFDHWSKTRLSRLLVDYLLRYGYQDSAKALAESQNITDLVDIDDFVQCARIARSLEAGDTKDALAWCAENKQGLKKVNERTQTDFELHLRLQQYVELIRKRDPASLIAATLHARKYFTPADLTVQAAAMLAMPPDTHIAPYAWYYDPERWRGLASMFRTTHQELLGLPKKAGLHVALQAGLSALKTPACHSAHLSSSSNANTASGASVCPICSTELNELAKKVPYANHSKSAVEADPVVLPNGRVYGRQRLDEFQVKMPAGAGRLRDPTEPEMVFGLGEARRVYIM